jgi:hypothetical protein
MSTYADFLRTQGASDDDVKLLDTPIARKAYDAQLAAAKESIDAYKQKADDWFEKVAQPNLTKAEQSALKANAELARMRSLVAQSTDDGLKQVAKDMGFTIDGNGNPPKDEPKLPAGFDPSKFLTTDSVSGMLDQAGANLARMQDMVLEHMQLYPGQRLNVAKLREEAVAAKSNVYDYWEKKYNVPAARDKQLADARAADEARIRKDERDKVAAEFASNYANPNTVPAGVSSNIFVPRPKAGREKQPWEASLEGESGSNDRVARAAKTAMERQATRTN